MSRRKLLRRGVFGVAALVGVDVFLVEPAWVEAVEVDVAIKGLPAAFEGYRVGQISDVHWPLNIDLEFLHWCWGLLAEMKPDVICCTGDFLETRVFRKDVPFDNVFDGVEAPDGVFGVLGNHDEEARAFVVDELREKTPIELIENRHVRLRRGGSEIALAGVGDHWYGVVDLEAALRGVPEDMPRILLSHNPDVAEEVPDEVRVDLQVSGHTHGGQLATPFRWAPKTNSRYGTKYLRGLVEGPRGWVYVNRGLSRGSRHWRFFSRPEVTVLRLVAG